MDIIFYIGAACTLAIIAGVCLMCVPVGVIWKWN